jgi:chromosome segregation ATPase
MSTVTESDLKRLEDLIVTRFSDLDRKLDIHIIRTDERFNTLDERFRSIDERFKSIDQRFDDLNQQMNQRFDDTNRRIDENSARLNTFSLGFLGIVGVLVTGLLGIVSKVVFFPNP